MSHQTRSQMCQPDIPPLSGGQPASTAGFYLRPSPSSDGAVFIPNNHFQRHLHLAGDSSFQEEASGDIAVQQVLRGGGLFMMCPEDAPHQLARVLSAAREAGRQDDVVVFDFFDEHSTHRYVPSAAEPVVKRVPMPLSWLSRRAAQHTGVPGGPIPAPRSAPALLETVKPLTATRLLKALREAQAGSSSIFEKGDLANVARHVRAFTLFCQRGARGLPAWSLSESRVREAIICVTMPPRKVQFSPVTREALAEAVAACVLLEVFNAAGATAQDAMENSIVCILPDVPSLAPPCGHSMLTQAQALKISAVLCSPRGVSQPEQGAGFLEMAGYAQGHACRTLDTDGNLSLVYFTLSGTHGVILPES